jgi:hypothetical protein
MMGPPNMTKNFGWSHRHRWEFAYYLVPTLRLLHPQNKKVGQELGIATGLKFTLPFMAFYVAFWVFSGRESPENWVGAVTIVMTNLVVGGYCYVAYMED